jgi:hypothetical protein
MHLHPNYAVQMLSLSFCCVTQKICFTFLLVYGSMKGRNEGGWSDSFDIE